MNQKPKEALEEIYDLCKGSCESNESPYPILGRIQAISGRQLSKPLELLAVTRRI